MVISLFLSSISLKHWNMGSAGHCLFRVSSERVHIQHFTDIDFLMFVVACQMEISNLITSNFQSRTVKSKYDSSIKQIGLIRLE